MSRSPGPNAAASNNGGLIERENELDRFAWRRKRQAVGRSTSNDWLTISYYCHFTVECCRKVVLSSSGTSAVKQWDRMGTYTYSGQTLHGRYVYTHHNFSMYVCMSVGMSTLIRTSHRASSTSLESSTVGCWVPRLMSTLVVSRTVTTGCVSILMIISTPRKYL